MSTEAEPAPPAEPPAKTSEVRYQYAPQFAPILEHLKSTLLVSTYQAGKLVVVTAEMGALKLSFHNFERAMGIAVAPGRIAVGSNSLVWLLRDAPELAPRIEPVGTHDACFLTRSAHFTGEIHGHEMAFKGDELWVVNTLFSCLCTLNENYSFVPRWRPKFISALAAEDRCHLNGFVLLNGQPKYATAMSETDTTHSWRPTKATSGVLIDVPTGMTVARGFAMPHSPRIYQGRVWVLDSGRGNLSVVEPGSGKVQPVVQMPGYTRGLAFSGQFAFVGLSKIRETATFGGVPIAEQRDQLKCGVGVVDLTTGRNVAHLEFQTGVEEIFDVQLLPGIRNPVFSGPFAGVDGQQPIWLAPGPG